MVQDKKENKSKLSYLIVIALGLFITGYISYQKGYKEGNIAGVEIATSKYLNNNQIKLDDCLSKAEREFSNRFELNSNPASEKDQPDARKWISSEIAKETEERRNRDREFCLKLYK